MLKMRCWLVSLLTVLVNRATGNHTVEGYEGENIILPCMNNKQDLKDVTVFWRFMDDINVYGISHGKNLEDEGSQFKNRTSLFPSEFKNGNFSLLLTNLTKSDKGDYSCFFPSDHISEDIELNVKGRRCSVQTMSQENNTAEMRPKIITLLVAFFTFIFNIV